ncbi:hypothetical protein GCM10023079_47190 [Streptomyces chitinivorans]
MRDASGPGPAEQEAKLRQAVEAMGPPRFYTLEPDGSLTKRDSL